MDLLPAARPTPSPLTPRLPHAEAAQAAKGDLVGGEVGTVRTETLPNGVRLIIAERPGAEKVKVQVGIGAGSINDPQGKQGLAHLLEHLAFEGSPKMSSTKQEDLRTRLGGVWNAWTNRNAVAYYGIVPASQAGKGAALLTDMFRNPAVTGPRVKQELAAVKNEMIFGDGSMSAELWHVHERLVHGDGPATNNVIGTRKTVDAITAKDFRRFHQSYFTGRNTVALVEGAPGKLPLDLVRAELGKLEPGARVDNSGVKGSFRPGRAIQVVRDASHKAVDLSLTVPIPAEVLEQVGEQKAGLVVNSISNELFERLRRNHHLTYGAWAEIQPSEAADGAILVLQASVAPDAVRAATRDLAAVAQDARDGFGARTLQRNKQMAANRLRMAEPTAAGPLGAANAAELAFLAALESDGVEVPDPAGVQPAPSRAERAKELRRLQAITNGQFGAAAAKLVDLEHLKVLAFGDVEAADVRGGLRDAGIATAGVAMNPVDLSMYEDMGVRAAE